MKPILNAVTTIARKAGKIILQAQNDPSTIQISQKSDNTTVSNVDVAVENFIIDNIKKSGFNDYFITEESGEFGNKDSRFTWIIDLSTVLTTLSMACHTAVFQLQQKKIMISS